jgi:hypothetical protein
MWTFVPPETPFRILAVWPATIVEKADDVEDYFMEQFDTRIKRVGCVKVAADTGRDYDFFFYVHDDDVMKFAMQRMMVKDPGMFCRWWEDIYFNKQEHEFPAEFCRCYPR